MEGGVEGRREGGGTKLRSRVTSYSGIIIN